MKHWQNLSKIIKMVSQIQTVKFSNVWNRLWKDMHPDSLHGTRRFHTGIVSYFVKDIAIFKFFILRRWMYQIHMQTSVENRYRSFAAVVFRTWKDDFDSCSVHYRLPTVWWHLLWCNRIYQLLPFGQCQKILSMYFYQDKSDAQIARKLKLSRQYVNRMKKLILRYISENK